METHMAPFIVQTFGFYLNQPKLSRDYIWLVAYKNTLAFGCSKTVIKQPWSKKGVPDFHRLSLLILRYWWELSSEPLRTDCSVYERSHGRIKLITLSEHHYIC